MTLRYHYVPTGHGDGSWGYSLDRVFGPLFSDEGPLFFAAMHAAIPMIEAGRERELEGAWAIMHSFFEWGESDAFTLEGMTTAEAIATEERLVELFEGRILVLSKYFAKRVQRRFNLLEPPPVIKFPFVVPKRETWHAEVLRLRLIHVNQRVSEEKAPLLIMHLAERMPDWTFLFTGARPLQGAYKHWFATAPNNVHYKCIPSKRAYYAQLAKATVALVASMRDNFGVAALEAMSLGVPYVAPQLFAYDEFVPYDHLYEPFSFGAMIACIERASRRRGEAPWTVEQAIERLLEVLP